MTQIQEIGRYKEWLEPLIEICWKTKSKKQSRMYLGQKEKYEAATGNLKKLLDKRNALRTEATIGPMSILWTKKVERLCHFIFYIHTCVLHYHRT